MSCDLSGRPYAKVFDVTEGTIVEVDNGFDCMHGGDVKTVYQDQSGRFFVECKEGVHMLDGQKQDDYYIGLYIKN